MNFVESTVLQNLDELVGPSCKLYFYEEHGHDLKLLAILEGSWYGFVKSVEDHTAILWPFKPGTVIQTGRPTTARIVRAHDGQDIFALNVGTDIVLNAAYLREGDSLQINVPFTIHLASC